MSGEIVKAVEALEALDITYETNPMGTILEADNVHELFAAAEAAHGAVDEDRVITTLEIDDSDLCSQIDCQLNPVVQREEGDSADFELGADDPLCRPFQPVPIECERAIEVGNADGNDGDSWLHCLVRMYQMVVSCAHFSEGPMPAYT